MRAILFYHQKRRDGGIRTGVESDGSRLLERFSPGSGEFDSALEWWINVYFEGASLPEGAEAIRAWLLEKQDAIKEQLIQLANELSAGIDPTWPFRKKFVWSRGTISGEIVCSSIRLVTSQRIAGTLNDLATHWPRRIESLETVAEVVSL